MPRHWQITPAWPGCAEAARRLGISPLIAQLLHNRGIAPDDARSFLAPELKTLHAPELLPGAVDAARIISQKVRERRPIIIYGDYDVDGITATAILWHLLKLAGAEVDFYIPHRLEEGYGLNGDALRQLRASGADTVISVDCGITAVQEAAIARQIGLTLIITDHHAPGPALPDADAIVHPGIGELRIADCESEPGTQVPGRAPHSRAGFGISYPNPDLCGAGVAFKLAWAIARNLCDCEKVTPEFREFLVAATGLAALGTIADVVPLTGENRVLARFGLTGLRESKLVGLRALIESAKLGDKKIDSDHVGFWLAPRLNAAGRMGHAQLAVELLTRADEARAGEIAVHLEEQNRRRQSLEKQIFNQACEQIDAQKLACDARRAIVVAADGWHAGVVGIVASRIVERYSRPAVLIALDNGVGQGSARSIRHFELHRALADCSEHLLAFGGHAMAAGLRIERDKVEPFTEAFTARANQLLTGKDLEPALRLDAEIGLGDLIEPLVRDLERMQPFGTGNARPRFASGWLQLDNDPRIVGKTGEHLQFSLTDGATRRKAIAFGKKDCLQSLLDHRRCRVAFEPILNTWNGRTSVEMQVVDFAFPEE